MRIERMGNKLTIRNIVMLLIVAILLSACGSKVHKNISQEMVDDTNAIVKLVGENIESGEELTVEELELLESYNEKYDALRMHASEDERLTKEEGTLYTVSGRLAEQYRTDKENMTGIYDYDFMKENIKHVIETGELPK